MRRRRPSLKPICPPLSRERITAIFGTGRNKISAGLISPTPNVPSSACLNPHFMLVFQWYNILLRRKLGLDFALRPRPLSALRVSLPLRPPFGPQAFGLLRQPPSPARVSSPPRPLSDPPASVPPGLPFA